MHMQRQTIPQATDVGDVQQKQVAVMYRQGRVRNAAGRGDVRRLCVVVGSVYCLFIHALYPTGGCCVAVVELREQ